LLVWAAQPTGGAQEEHLTGCEPLKRCGVDLAGEVEDLRLFALGSQLGELGWNAPGATVRPTAV
jgi:hypothetical protein